MRNDLIELTKPYPSKYVKDDGRGNDHVPHHIVTQRLLQIFGTVKIEIVRELYDGEKLTGVLMRLTVPGHEPVEEFGDSDNPQSKSNGARAKDAASDAIKRCAMRLGNGLHLWAQADYFLHEVLVRDHRDQGGNGGEGTNGLGADAPVHSAGRDGSTGKSAVAAGSNPDDDWGAA